MGRSSILAAGLALAVCVALLAAARPEPPPPAQVSETVDFTLDDWPLTSASATRGRVVYERNCIGCHGEQGLGDGPSAEFLDPRPRNFQAGNFKFRTTPSGEMPQRDDIVHVVRCGLQGSAMRSFPLMPQREIEDVADYVLYLTDFGVVQRDVEYELDGEPFASLPAEDYEEIRDEAPEIATINIERWPIDASWYRLQLLERQLWELPFHEGPVVLSATVEIIENPRDDAWSMTSPRPYMVRSRDRGALPEIRELFEAEEIDLLRTFHHPQHFDEALFERPELERLNTARQLLAQCLRLGILVDAS